jgi:predicted acylesterase/phospholipase RssA
MRSIQHLVIPGGAIYGLSYYGSLKYLCQNNAFQLHNIKTIHSTSVGSIISTILALKFEWSEMDNYFINRPWHEVFKFSLCSIVKCFKNNGMFDISTIKDIFLPLFSAKDIPIDITMKDFYETTGIELHFFTIDVSNFSLVDINYETFPEWTVVEAVYASSCAPILFKPFNKNGSWYTDGGILANCPLKQLCESKIKPKLDEIISITTEDRNGDTTNKYEKYNLLQYVFDLLSKIVNKIQPTYIPSKEFRQYEVIISQSLIPVYDVFSIVNSPQQRAKLIEHGANLSHDCCSKILNSPDYHSNTEKIIFQSIIDDIVSIV